MSTDSNKAAPLTRLVDDPHEGSELAAHVAAAESTLSRSRLVPEAVDRIEAKLEALNEPAGSRVWQSLRAPVFACAAAALAFVVWSRPHVNAPTIATQASTRPLRLDNGTLAATTDENVITVETPAARVEVAAHSQVRITVINSEVRIAAASGSARILYYDGRVELVAPAAPTSEVVVPALLPLPAPSTAPRAPVATRPHHAAPAASEKPVEAVAMSPQFVDAEHQSFADAMARVRPAPIEALALLDAHLAAYPNGVLREDAERVRVAVLLRLERKSEALTALERISAPPPELRIDRAELRAEVGRYGEAVADFGAVLVSNDERFAERALFGRAMARQKMGDRPRMTEDLERFLLLYPHGELADRARLELRRATSESSR